ncbi:unnamed protein product [Periconia digitata]|uniref:Uncharacterized protein n=1 Tax=Periconia digitata TaxID=1303443 RepID=A0A9W4UJD9_9PLEO|nr:unnamed protein product [Periconia digitata]
MESRSRVASFSLFLPVLLLLSTLSLAFDVPDLELLPLTKHRKRYSFHKRQENGNDTLDGLDLQNTGVFLWGVETATSNLIANLTLDFARDYEAILDMDDFAGLVKSIDCTAPEISLDFNSEKAFGKAHEAWDWVKQDDNYTFVLVASAEACDAETRRQPFLVNDLVFDEKDNRVIMQAVLKTWEDIAESYSFKIYNEPLPAGATAKRDGTTLNVAHDFSRSLFNTNAKGLDIGVSCSDCGTEGSVLIDFDIGKILGVPAGASISVTPQNIAAQVLLSLELNGNLASGWAPSALNVVSVPITGINIAGVFKVGVFLTVDLGFEIGEWVGTAQASMGARMAIPNTSVLKINLFGKGDTQVAGWVPTFTKIPPSLSAKVEGSAEAYAQAGIEVTATGLKQGFTVGVDMKMPYIRADFSAMADTRGVCGTEKTMGVDLQADIGAELLASAATGDNAPFWTYTLFDKTLGTLIDKCYPFGPENAQASGDGNGGNHQPPKSKSRPSKSKTSKPVNKSPKSTRSSAPVATAKPITKKPKSSPKGSKTPPKTSKTISSTKAPKSSDKASDKPSDKSSTRASNKSDSPSKTSSTAEKTSSASSPSVSGTSKSDSSDLQPSSESNSDRRSSHSTTGASSSTSKSSSATGDPSSTVFSTVTTSGSWNSTRTRENETTKTAVSSSISSISSSTLASSSLSVDPSVCSMGTGTGTKTANACRKTDSCTIQDPDVGGEDGFGDEFKKLKRDPDARRRALEKRGKKKGQPCASSSNPDAKKWELKSANFESSGTLDKSNSGIWWGWEEPNQQCDYSWSSDYNKDNDYDTEHVMEWQVITDFFATMQSKGEMFDHPDPRKASTDGTKQVDFCTYWYESWNLGNDQAFTITISGSDKLTPWDHIAASYPSGSNQWKAELIALQRNINAPPKSSLFMDDAPLVWKQKDMVPWIASRDRRGKVLERMRLFLGVRKYLSEDEVRKIFKRQKEGMAAILDELDTSMSSHARVESGTTFTPWRKQNFKDQWNSFMDDKWKKAVTKHANVMNHYESELRKAWCPNIPAAEDKDFCDKLKDLWDQYKQHSGTFNRPW